MRPLIFTVCLVLVGTALACASLRAAREGAATESNELSPVAKLWSEDGEGVQVQIAVPARQIRVADARLPVVVWFRNATDKPKSVLSVYPAFAPHGAITVTDADGKNIIVGECRKKHRTGEIVLAPGEQRGFLCDAFNQPCFGKAEGELRPGTYVVQFRKSNKVTVEVVK